MRTVEACSCVRNITIESRPLPSGENPESNIEVSHTPQGVKQSSFSSLYKSIMIRRTLDTKANVDDLRFDGYQFSPRLDEIQCQLGTARLRSLELNNCRNIGYLFNNLLCNLPHIRLKAITVTQTAPLVDPGYLGKEKMECFLLVYKGLEEVSLLNLGQSRPFLGAILSQWSTLKCLVLRETLIEESPGPANKEETSREMSDEAHIRRVCPYLQHLSVDSIRVA